MGLSSDFFRLGNGVLCDMGWAWHDFYYLLIIHELSGWRTTVVRNNHGLYLWWRRFEALHTILVKELVGENGYTK